MGILPADPRADAARGVVASDIDGEGDSAEDISACKGHETEVLTGSEVGVTRKNRLGFSTSLVESTDAEDSIYTRDESNPDGRSRDEQEGDPSKTRGRPASDILKDVEPMTLGDVVCICVNGYIQMAVLGITYKESFRGQEVQDQSPSRP